MGKWDIIGILLGYYWDITRPGELTKSYGKSPFLMRKWDIIGILLGYFLGYYPLVN